MLQDRILLVFENVRVSEKIFFLSFCLEFSNQIEILSFHLA
jgi:hypothetical protein